MSYEEEDTYLANQPPEQPHAAAHLLTLRVCRQHRPREETFSADLQIASTHSAHRGRRGA
jgi:hypothetical protein